MATNPANDYAIIIGVSTYQDPSIPSLHGSVNDANAFESWIVSQGIPNTRIKKVISNAGTPPTWSAINAAFNEVVSWTTQATLQQNWDNTLYIYAAGHGFGSMNTFTDAALLTEDADTNNWLNVAVTRYADYFMRCAPFGQIVVVIDSCRDIRPKVPIRDPYWPDTMGYRGTKTVKHLIAMAAGYGQQAREGEIAGTQHGYFTVAFLEALKGAATGPVLSDTEISRFVKNRITDWGKQGVPLPTPKFFVDQLAPIALRVQGAQEPEVEFAVDATFLGMLAELKFGGMGEPEIVQLDKPSVRIRARAGLYSFEVIDSGTRTKLFRTLIEVPSPNVIHVR